MNLFNVWYDDEYEGMIEYLVQAETKVEAVSKVLKRRVRLNLHKITPLSFTVDRVSWDKDGVFSL